MSENKHTNSKTFILGIDVGGTGIKYRLYEKSGTLHPDETFHGRQGTEKGLNYHISQIANIIKDAIEYAHENGGEVAAVGIGSPGRFTPEGAILPGTNTNMETSDAHEFDNLNLQNEYKKQIGRLITFLNSTPTRNEASHKALKALINSDHIYVKNDADVMLTGMIHALKSGHAFAHDQDGNPIIHTKGAHHFDQKSSLGAIQQIGLFGIGTGIGHSIIRLDPNGTFKNVTDGHASKLLISVDDADQETLKKAEEAMNSKNQQDGHPEKTAIHRKDDKVRAEDLFREGMLFAIAGINDARDFNSNNPAHLKAAEFMGKYMARAIEAIASGQNEDITGQGWDEKNKQIASETTTYLIGGGPAKGYLDKESKEDSARGIVGKEIIKAAVQELNDRIVTLANEGKTALAYKLEHIRIAQYVGPEIAEHAAADMAMDALKSKQQGR